MAYSVGAIRFAIAPYELLEIVNLQEKRSAASEVCLFAKGDLPLTPVSAIFAKLLKEEAKRTRRRVQERCAAAYSMRRPAASTKVFHFAVSALIVASNSAVGVTMERK